ncbi:hypothetical protein LCGC14_2529000, partial [marine sediment metagenome]
LVASWFRPFGVQSIPAGSVWNTKHDINFSGFHAYTRTIVTKIVEELGFTYDDGAVTDSLWDELAIPCPVNVFAVSTIIADPLNASWDNTDGAQTETGPGPNDLFDFEFGTQISDVDGLFDNANDQYDIDRTANIICALSNVVGTWTTSSANLKIQIRKNGGIIIERLISSVVTNFDFSMAVVTPVQSGDVITATLNIVTAGGTVVVDAGAIFEIKDSGSVENHSDTLNIANFIPEINKKDFLRWIFALFNVQVDTNSLSNTVTLKPFDSVLISSEQNWSKNLDISKAIDEGITLPYAQSNTFNYLNNIDLKRDDTEGIYSIVNDLLRQQLNLIKSGFGASDGAQRNGIYIRGTAVAEYPTYIMHTTRLAGMNTTAASAAFTIDAEGAEYSAGDYIEVGGEFRQINGRTSDTAGTVSINFDSNNASQPWTLRRFELMDLIPPRIARIVASQGNYDIVQGTEDVVTSIVGGKEAVFHDDLLWNNIIANSY